MKALLIYYSLNGNSSLIAEAIRVAAGADILRLETADEKKRGGFLTYAWGGWQVLTHKTPRLKPCALTIDSYDLIILGGPVWAASPAPALRTFIKQTRISDKQVALFCCHKGGRKNALEKLEKLLPHNAIVGKIDFIEPLKQDQQILTEKITAWLKQIIP
jgi:flavodoxin